jgi:DNA-binding NarL/FixJ family response regulator
LVVADDPLARAGLATLLAESDAVNVIGQATGEATLVDDVDLYQPEVIVWDLGWDADALPAAFLEIEDPVVALLPDEGLMAEAWAAGAAGLLLRDGDAEKLVRALQAVTEELFVVDQGLDRTRLPVAPPEPSAAVEPLTPREMEVLQLLAEGLSNRAIGQALTISEHTVKFHVNAIMGKLEAQSRTEAVVRATRLGLILL